MKAKNFFEAILVPVLLAGQGCIIDRPVMSPRYQELRPSLVAVLPVENRTLLDLTKVTTAGLLQRVTLGAGEVNVPEVFRSALAEGLERKGCGILVLEKPEAEPDFRRPLPAGVERGFDGALYASIASWRQGSASQGGGIEFGGTLEIVRVGDADRWGGEVLYKVDFHHQTGLGSDAIRTAADLEEEIRRAARGALSDLPAAPAAPASPPKG